MRGSSGQRSRPAVGTVWWEGGLVALCFLAAFAAPAAADPPAANKPATVWLRRTKLLKERDRLWQGASRLLAQGKLGEAIPAIHQMLAIERQLFGNANAGIAQSLEWLGRSHLKPTNLRRLGQRGKKFRSIRTKLYGEKDWRVTDAWQAVRDVDIRSRLTAEERRELINAEQANAQAVALYEKGGFPPSRSNSPSRPRTSGGGFSATSTRTRPRASTTWLHCTSRWGITRRPSRSYRQALEIRKKVLGDQHPDTATSLNNLAALYQSMGDYAKAEPLYRQALEIRQESPGGKHPTRPPASTTWPRCTSRMGDYAKAEPLYRQALEIRKKVLGENHPDYATSLNNLAVLYQSHGGLREGRAALSAGAGDQQEGPGGKPPGLRPQPQQPGWLYRAMGDYAKAEPLFGRRWRSARKPWAKSTPTTATSLNNLAVLYQSMGDYAKAEPLFRQALEIRKKVLGEQHPDYATSLNNLAALYRVDGRLREGGAALSAGAGDPEESPGRKPPGHGHEPQQPGSAVPVAWGITRRRSRSIGRRWRSTRKSWGNTTRTRPRASTTWPCCTSRWGTTRRRSRSIGRPWRSTRKSWAKTTPTRPRASTTWLCCTSRWGITRRRSRSVGRRWRSPSAD